ncbi:MAG: chemotaxis protein CheW [Gammaproteobacteria bacterium]
MLQPQDEVYSLLIPVAGSKLLLPRLCVAEVMGYTRPQPLTGAPAWLLGLVRWQDQDLPLVSFEGLCGRRVPERANRTRVAVVYAINAQLDPPAFALMTQGYPYLVRVNAAVLVPDVEEPYSAEVPVLNRVHMANERPVIPDLEAIEEKLLEALPQRRATH